MRVSLTSGQSSAVNRVYIGDLVLVFSYETIVAYFHPEDGWVVSENVWSKTTGKHIAQETPRGAPRVPPSVFEARLDNRLAWIREGS